MKSWATRMFDAIERERKEAEQRYNITIHQTNITCNRCGANVTCPVKHKCFDIAMEEVRDRKEREDAENQGSLHTHKQARKTRKRKHGRRVRK